VEPPVRDNRPTDLRLEGDSMAPADEIRWRSTEGGTIACVEKLKVMRENLDEIRTLCQDALDDAVLMGCAPEQFRDVLAEMILSLESAYKPDAPSRPA
jgi:hypothetical protein